MIYVVGNGESRREIDIQDLRTKGKVYGCNAIYRDEKVDVLVAGDHNMQHEIYFSGYAKNHLCYFTFWNKLPASVYQMTISNLGLSKDMVLKDTPCVFEHGKSSEEFVMQGHSDAEVIYVCWIDPEGDKVRSFEDHYPHHPKGFGRELTSFSTGNMAVYMAAHDNPGEDIYLVGFDMKILTEGKINNVYLGTSNYDHDIMLNDYRGTSKDIMRQYRSRYELWKSELKLVMSQFSNNFIGIGDKGHYYPFVDC